MMESKYSPARISARTPQALALVVIAWAALAGCSGESAKDAGCVERDGGSVATYTATSPRGGRPASGAIDAAVDAMCERARALGVAVEIHRRGADQVEVEVDSGRLQELDAVTAPGQLSFYDWEPNVVGGDAPLNDIARAIGVAARARPRAEETDLPPDGPSDVVASRLGGDARKIREYYDVQNDSTGERYYLLDARGDLVRPDVNAFSTEPRTPPSGGRLVRVPRGIAIVEAEKPEGATENTPAQYYVIEDDVELSGADIKDPEQNFDPQTSEPIVTMEFTERGKRAFARVTRRIAKRGQNTLPRPGQPPTARFQRFMIALDGQIVSLATIDFISNPEGISGATGAQINGLGSIEETKDLADSLRIGPLPVRLERVR